MSALSEGVAPPPDDTLREDHTLLVEAIRQAGAIALKHFRNQPEEWEKSPGNLVSEADLASEVCLFQHLCRARPDYGWLSEESDDDIARLSAGRVWVVDPIDGTRSFLNGRPEFAVAGALIVDATPVAAAVFNPATDEMFEAMRGGGARLNGTALSVSTAAGLTDARLLSGRTEMQQKAWAERFPECTIHSVSSIAYELALVAAGRFDALISVWPKHEWDIASGELLVAEAGGRASTAEGAALEYNRPRPKLPSCIASNGLIQDALIKRLSN